MAYLPHRPGPPVALQLEISAVDVRMRASSSATDTSSILYVPSLTLPPYSPKLIDAEVF
jgi:hypothetical protein